MNRFISLNDNNKIITTRCGNKAVKGEISSELGEIGQIMQEDGTFINDPLDTLKAELAEVNSQMDEKIKELSDAKTLGDTALIDSITAEYDALVIQAISLEYEIETGGTL